MEHVEIEDRAPIHRLYRDLVYSGLAFGAERWLASLQRMCERIACLMVSGNSTRDLGGGNILFFACICASYLGIINFLARCT